MKLKIVYDNEARKPLVSSWGFSAFIEGKEENVLFDTGDKAGLLKNNMAEMGIDVDIIDKIVISHEHHDHTGGLFDILDGSMKVYLLKEFSEKFKDKVRKDAKVVEVDGMQKISRGVFTTGKIGTDMVEQSLLLEHDGGFIVLTGCAHPGLSNILDAASKYGDIKGAIGGFHGFDKLDELDGLSIIVPCHCTKYKDKIRKKYPERSMDCYAGLELDLEGE
ncbi:MAG: MBL fold metallo-hydrolase [Thermoplasmatota archaeon]